MRTHTTQPDHFPWQRFFRGGLPVYVSTEAPNWFVPTGSGDAILRSCMRGRCNANDITARRFLARIPESRPFDYPGRRKFLQLERIDELWFHLTDRCNLACRHCLFSSSPAQAPHLSRARVEELADEAARAGCRLFALTGGEPLVHPEIDAIVAHLLARPQAHVVMLTNGLELVPFLERLRPDPQYLHLQISLDGLEQAHDRLRGRGTFQKVLATFAWLKANGYPWTISMCVTRDNVRDMPAMVDLAADVGAGNVHYMWYFVRGRGTRTRFAAVSTIYNCLLQADARARARGIAIDNLEALKTQVFAPPGTVHDGTTAGWASLAVGPDGKLYPTAALVGVAELATEMPAGLVQAWQTSPVLEHIRAATVKSTDSPLRFMLGGGDIDHSYLHKKTFLGDDPYEGLYENLAMHLICEEARQQPERDVPGLRLQMGETLKSCGAHGSIALVHSNCLLATARNDSLTTVKEFYASAVADTRTDILNPVCYDPALIEHIPDQFRFRGYGCGSPVMDAGIVPGETVVDLGCGSGVECFIAARQTGSAGRVIGVDMLDPMLELARRARPLVAKNLGYDNLEFRKGFLEDLPLDSDSVDVVISNCVMNLSVHKRRAWREIHRVLKPGGRLVISDVVCETEPDPAIRNDETLRGECIAGALTARHLTALLEEIGFIATTLLKRFPYRIVADHPFFSLTFSAVKPAPSETVSAMYRGPMPFLMTSQGRMLEAGVAVPLARDEAQQLGEQVFLLDEAGAVTNMELENTCACYKAPEQSGTTAPAPDPVQPEHKFASGCMVCGAPLVYEREPRPRACSFCGMEFAADSVCEQGHYVCNECHARDAVAVIRQICSHSAESDMIRLFDLIRSHPAIPLHGPEYHAMIPGVVLTAYRNAGGEVPESLLEAGITRGQGIAGGFCGFMGVCGSAVGVGIAFSLLIGANPLTPDRRRIVQSLVHTVLGEIAALKAARCCQRDGWIALTTAARLSGDILPIPLQANYPLVCRQQHLNRECLGKACPLHPRHRQ